MKKKTVLIIRYTTARVLCLLNPVSGKSPESSHRQSVIFNQKSFHVLNIEGLPMLTEAYLGWVKNNTVSKSYLPFTSGFQNLIRDLDNINQILKENTKTQQSEFPSLRTDKRDEMSHISQIPGKMQESEKQEGKSMR